MKKDPAPLNYVLESILFAVGDPLSVSRLAKIVGENKKIVKEALEQLKERLAEQSGLRLLQKEGKVQLVSAKQHAPFIERAFKKQHREDLTKASLEVLSIVAYRGPVSREEIERIRGVNSSYILRKLLMRGMIQKQDAEAFPQYRVSFETLRTLGVGSQEELPQWEEIRAQVEEAHQILKKDI